MALNNYYQYPYQYPNTYQPQAAQPSINWVSGDREASAYPVAPNNAVALWSQSEPVVYLKQADATGKPSMKIYDLVERAQTVTTEEKTFATREELDRIKKNIDSYESLLLSLPRGYLFEQTINGKPYCYRKHREGSAIVSEYIGASESDEAKKAHADYRERKRIESNLRIMRKEEDKLVKALRHYGS